MAVKKVKIVTRAVPVGAEGKSIHVSSGEKHAELPKEFELTVTDDRHGSEIGTAFQRSKNEHFDSIASHVVKHVIRDEESVIPREDALLFERLNVSGFFDFIGNRRTDPDERVFNLLLRIEKNVPPESREHFFAKGGLGSLILSEVSEHKKSSPPFEDYGFGQTSDYLRRIGSVLSMLPESERPGFLSKDVPKMLAESKSYLEFLERTWEKAKPFAGKYMKT